MRSTLLQEVSTLSQKNREDVFVKFCSCTGRGRHLPEKCRHFCMRGKLRDDLFEKKGNLGDDLCVGVDTYFKGVDPNHKNF